MMLVERPARLRRDRHREHVRRHALRPRRLASAAASASRRRRRSAAGGPGIFEPIHGSAPDIAGTGKRQPAGAILSVAMLLDDARRARRRRRAIEAPSPACSTTARARPTSGGNATTERDRRRRSLAPSQSPHEVTRHERPSPNPDHGLAEARRHCPTTGDDDRRRGRHPLASRRGRRDLLRASPAGRSCRSTTRWPRSKHPIRHVLVRHEQGAGHMAQGYARATGKVGVCHGDVGPGRDEPRHRRSPTRTSTPRRSS